MLMLHRLQCWIPFYRRTPQPWKSFAFPWNISFSESTMFLVDTEDPRFLNDSTIYPCHKTASICCQQSCYWLKHVLVTCAKKIISEVYVSLLHRPLPTISHQNQQWVPALVPPDVPCIPKHSHSLRRWHVDRSFRLIAKPVLPYLTCSEYIHNCTLLQV